MRLYCFECGKSVTNEMPHSVIFRAIAQCPECIAKHSPPTPVSPLPLWGVEARVSMAMSGAYQVEWEDYSHTENIKREFTITAIDKPSAILAWNRIAEALNEVEG